MSPPSEMSSRSSFHLGVDGLLLPIGWDIPGLGQSPARSRHSAESLTGYQMPLENAAQHWAESPGYKLRCAKMAFRFLKKKLNFYLSPIIVNSVEMQSIWGVLGHFWVSSVPSSPPFSLGLHLRWDRAHEGSRPQMGRGSPAPVPASMLNPCSPGSLALHTGCC